jgi:hypothetical protein
MIPPDMPAVNRSRRFGLRRAAVRVAWGFLLVPWSLWAAAALWFDFPLALARAPLALLLPLAVVVVFLRVRPAGRALAVALALLAAVTGWWLSLRPRADRDWMEDVAHMPRAERDGDRVVIHNVRNFDYRSESDWTARWETREVDLSRLTGMDLAINFWGSPWIAHPIVSFQFADAPPLAFSIEIRREKGEGYSVLAGLFRQYELIYLAADERDVLRLRTNHRRGEQVYLYRIRTGPEAARARFLEYLAAINDLNHRPRWYNAITTNCTTAIRRQRPPDQRAPWDWRILINGKLDQLFHQQGYFVDDGLPFAELRARALINEAAQAADRDPGFSRAIRAGRPGFGG